MDATDLTYENLFALLLSLGFRDVTANASDKKKPRAFVHDKTDTVLLYRKDANGLVSGADILSTEVHLNARGITDTPLESLIADMLVNK